MQPPPDVSPDRPKALRVFIVEDNGMIGMLLAEMLEEMGHKVCGMEATEAKAVSAVLRCKPDLMIVDAWLDDGSGISAVETILRAGPLPHLFTTGDVARVSALRPDAVVIQKPYYESDLASGIQRALEADLRQPGLPRLPLREPAAKSFVPGSTR